MARMILLPLLLIACGCGSGTDFNVSSSPTTAAPTTAAVTPVPGAVLQTQADLNVSKDGTQLTLASQPTTATLLQPLGELPAGTAVDFHYLKAKLPALPPGLVQGRNAQVSVQVVPAAPPRMVGTFAYLQKADLVINGNRIAEASVSVNGPVVPVTQPSPPDDNGAPLILDFEADITVDHNRTTPTIRLDENIFAVTRNDIGPIRKGTLIQLEGLTGYPFSLSKHLRSGRHELEVYFSRDAQWTDLGGDGRGPWLVGDCNFFVDARQFVSYGIFQFVTADP